MGSMSNIFGTSRAGGPAGPDALRTVPTGDTVGTYSSYLDAQKAVDYLADQAFPVQMVSIVGNDLKMVERVTGRLSYPRVALSGALSGMWFGLFVGVLLSFFSTSPGYFSIMTSVLMGAAFFMLFGIVTYAMQRGKRDFTSTSQVVATSYNVIVSPEAAHEARRLLQQLPMTTTDAGARQQAPQPWQQPGQQQGQAPQRPSGWADPYGQQQGQQGHQQGQQQPPVPGAAPANEPEPAPQPRSAVRYPDLPDGRPQYGVRITDDNKPAAGDRTPESGHHAEGDNQRGSDQQ